jgi:hypothetical protein
MNSYHPVSAASDLYFALLHKKYLPNTDAVVYPYIESEEVRSNINRMAKSSGVIISKKEKFIHMLVHPTNSIYANSITELRKSVRGMDSKLDLYLMGVIWMVLYSEADTELSTRIQWENKGITYHQLEELTTNVLGKWKDINERTDGSFSEDWSLAVDQMEDKWDKMHLYKKTNGKISMPKTTRFGLIECAMRELVKDRLVFIRTFPNTSIVTPTEAFYERLKARFGQLGRYKERYDVMKMLIEEAKDSNELGA